MPKQQTGEMYILMNEITPPPPCEKTNRKR